MLSLTIMAQTCWFISAYPKYQIRKLEDIENETLHTCYQGSVAIDQGFDLQKEDYSFVDGKLRSLILRLKIKIS